MMRMVILMTVLLMVIEMGGGERCGGMGRQCICTHDWSVVACIGKGLTSLPNVTSISHRLKIQFLNLQSNAIRVVRGPQLTATFPNLVQLDVRDQRIDGRCVHVAGRLTSVTVLTDCLMTTDMTTDMTPTNATTETMTTGQEETFTLPTLTDAPERLSTTEATTWEPLTTAESVTSMTSQAPTPFTVDEYADTPDDDADDMDLGIIIGVSGMALLLAAFIVHCVGWLLWCWRPRACSGGFCYCCPRKRSRGYGGGGSGEGGLPAVENLSFESVELYAVPRHRHGKTD